MNDVINRKDAIGAILNVGHIAELSDGDAVIRVSAVNYVLRNLPSAQPEPKEGHWIRRDCGLDVECKCSRCGYKDFVKPRDEYWFNRNFCPNCGARMTISTK